jgi:hypothetical protein
MPTSDIILLKDVRLSFPRLFKPRAFKQGQDPRYEATFLLDPSNAAHAAAIKEIKSTAMKIAKEHFGENVPKALAENLCYGDGNKKDYDGYADQFYISTANKIKPAVVDRRKQPLTQDSGKPYAGCYVNAQITLWVLDWRDPESSMTKRGIYANLIAVQFNRDGEPFGTRTDSAVETFEDLGDDGEDTSLGGESALGDDDDSFLG